MYNDLDTNNRVYLLYCDIGNYRHWVKESTNAEKFFSNFDKLISTLKELMNINYEYLDPTPSFELNELQENEQKYYQAFLSRSWVTTISEAARLKTDKGKCNKIKSFFDSLEPYQERFSEETLKMLNKAKSEQPDYTLKKNNKAEKDRFFLIKTDKILDLQNDIMTNIEQNNDDIAWFYQNGYLLFNLMCEETSYDILYDITRIMLACVNGERYLSLKYNMSRSLAKKYCITSSSLINGHRNIKKYARLGSKYFISTHGAPCEKCQEQRGKIYDIKDAEIGVNFPPFCSHGCSTALLYSDGITKINQQPFSYPDKKFAKALNLYMDGQYEQAAEYGLEACLLVPESERYIQYVPEMLAKVNRYKEAVQILDNYISITPNPRDDYTKQRDRYKKKIK